MILGEMSEEVAGSAPVVTSRVRMERGTEGIDSAVEDRSQPVLEPRTPRAIHGEGTGRGRMCWATARAY